MEKAAWCPADVCLLCQPVLFLSSLLLPESFLDWFLQTITFKVEAFHFQQTKHYQRCFPTKRKYSIHRKVVSFLMGNISDMALACLMFVLCLGKKAWSLINKNCCRTESNHGALRDSQVLLRGLWSDFLSYSLWFLLPVVSAQDTYCCTVKNMS